MLIGTKRALLGGAEFLPTQITGLQLWLAADRGLSLSDGDPVGTWPDQSGNGNDAAQATAAKKPTYKVNIVNGKPVVRGDGTDDYLATSAFASALTQPNTILVVGSMNNAEGDVAYFHDGIIDTDRNAFLSYIADTPDGYLLHAGLNLSTAGIPKSAFHIWISLFNEAESKLWEDNGEKLSGDAGVHSLTGLCLLAKYDGTASLDGDIAEVAIYDSDIGAANRVSLFQYASNKYGIALS